jgi:hypothetical protein
MALIMELLSVRAATEAMILVILYGSAEDDEF